MNNDNLLLQFCGDVFTKEQLRLLSKNNVPLYGNNGLRKYLASQSFTAFLYLYFGDEFTLELPELHRRFVAEIQNIITRLKHRRAGVKLAKAIPRNHAKSSYFARLLPLYCFLFDTSPLTVLLGNNDDAARRLVTNIKTSIETNEAIIEDFASIKGKQWGTERLESSNGAVIVAYGKGSGSIRGLSTGKHRPALVILDDIDDDKSVRSAVELANDKDWLDKSVLQLGDNISFTTSYIAIGTIIRRTSLMQYMLDSADSTSEIQSAVLSFATHEEQWNAWEHWYINAAKQSKAPRDALEDSFYQEHKNELIDGAVMLWERPDSYYYAMRYKLAYPKAFYSELQNTPQENDSTFVVQWVGAPNLTTLVAREYDILCFIDPAIKGGKQNDLSAYVELLYHRQRKEVYVYYLDAAQRSYADTINAVAMRLKTSGIKYSGLWIESNSAGFVIKDLLQDRLNKDNIQLRVNDYYTSMNKNEKIGLLSEYMARQQLFFTEQAKTDELVHELELWPFAKHDDCLDAISAGMLWLEEHGKLKLI